ncbi:MAG: hypothetical protein RLZZ301_1696 [Bacteroidota bacterium]|jgi:hypothetical protein
MINSGSFSVRTQHAIERANSGSEGLRAHGKLNGADVFSWMQPPQEALLAFMHANPGQLIWLGNAAEIEAILEQDTALHSKFEAIAIYGSSNAIFCENQFESIDLSLTWLLQQGAEKQVVVITGTDTNTAYTELKVKSFFQFFQRL